MNFDALSAAKPAIGRLELRDRRGWTSMGTGFVVGERSVLTALHVVADRAAPAVTLLGELRFVRGDSSIPLTALTAYDSADDWAVLTLAEPAGVASLPMAPDLPFEQSGWWTFGYPGLNDVEGIATDAELLDPNAAYERGTAISVFSEKLKATQVGGLSGAPLMRGGSVYGILRSDLEENRAEGRRSFGFLYATSIARILDRADLQSAQPNPYQGMRPFDENRAAFFFGRAREASELVDRLRASRLAVLVGGSGSGKSSLLRAGLLPLVRAQRLAEGAAIETIVFQPRSWPFQELALAVHEHLTFPRRPESLEALRDALAGETALADLVDQELHHRHRGERSRGGLLVVVDQMEELYAGEGGGEAQALLRLLCGAARRRDSRVWVAGAIRDGFMGDLLQPSANTETLRAALVPVGPIATPERLRELIARPAESAGLTFDPPELPDRIAEDAAEAPGGLPLLQYALDRLWQERKGNRMTGTAYAVFGGVRGVIAHHAQAVFDDLDEPTRLLAKRLFLRLVRIRSDGPNTRRLVSREALAALSDGALPLARRFVGARLLVETAGGIEIAHEALIREWKPLREWVKSAPEGELRLQQIEDARSRWTEGGERREDLLPAHRLRPLADWALRNSVDVPPAERRFLVENLLATDLPGEEWVPRFPVPDVEEALARPGRTSEEELRLLAGLYAASAGAELRRRRLADLVVREAASDVGARAGKLAVDREGADWLIGVADDHRPVRHVLTGLLNEGPTQAKLLDKLPKTWGSAVRRAAGIRLAGEQRATILFVAAAVFVAAWLADRVWWLLDLALQVAGLPQIYYFGELNAINLPVWAATGVYLDKRADVVGRPLSRRALWGTAAVVALTERLLNWLPQSAHTLLYGSSRGEFFSNLLANFAAYAVTAIVLMPVFARRAAPATWRGRWLRLAVASATCIAVEAYARQDGGTALAANYVRHLSTAWLAVVAATWAAHVEWRPAFQSPAAEGGRQWRRMAAAAATALVVAALVSGWLVPRLLSPAGLVEHAARLRDSGQLDRSFEVLRLACNRDSVPGCSTLAQQLTWEEDGERRALGTWAAERGCRLEDLESCRIWVRSGRTEADRRRSVVACAKTRDAELCEEATGILLRRPEDHGWDAWSRMADELCGAQVATACGALADAWSRGTWAPRDPARVESYRRKACLAGSLALCAPAPPPGPGTPADLEACRRYNWSACEALPSEDLRRLAESMPPAEEQRIRLFQLACEGGSSDACLAFGELRSRERRLLAAAREAVPEGIRIPPGFAHTRLFEWNTVVEGVALSESVSLSLLRDGSHDLQLQSVWQEGRPLQPRLAVSACYPGSSVDFGALLALSGPLPVSLPLVSPFRRGPGFAAGWDLLTADPVEGGTDSSALCAKVGDEGSEGAVEAVTPAAGGSYLVRSTQPGTHDLLAELRTWPMPDRSLIVAWRVLKTWPAPPRPRE